MNQIVNTSLLVGDKFMPEMHLRQPGNKKKYEKFVQTEDTNYIYKNELEKACFQNDMVYAKYKDLEKRTDKLSKEKPFATANNPKHDGYQRGLASMVCKFFDKKSKGSGIKDKIKENQENQQLANELHKPIIRKFKKQKCILQRN